MRQAGVGRWEDAGLQATSVRELGRWRLVPEPRRAPHSRSEPYQICFYPELHWRGSVLLRGQRGARPPGLWLRACLEGKMPQPAQTRPVPLTLQASRSLLNPLHFPLSPDASIPALSFRGTRPQQTPLPQEVSTGAALHPHPSLKKIRLSPLIFLKKYI